jgi:Holliday junction resolvase
MGKKTNYQRGADMERRFVKWLRDKDWIAVRSAGSRGSFDVIAANGGRIIVAQLKRDGRITELQRQELLRDAVTAGAVALLVTKPERGRDFEARILTRGGCMGELYF